MAGRIEERDAVLGETAVHGYQPLLVRRYNHLERQITDLCLFAGGSHAPTVEKKVFAWLQALSFANCGAVDIFVGLADWFVCCCRMVAADYCGGRDDQSEKKLRKRGIKFLVCNLGFHGAIKLYCQILLVSG